MSFRVDNVFMAGKPETLKDIKENIKEKFNISESGKVKEFFGVYQKWIHDAKGTYAKMTMEKHVKNLVKGYNKYTGNDLKVQKNPGALVTNLNKVTQMNQIT